jgi:hypothetical protein
MEKYFHFRLNNEGGSEAGRTEDRNKKSRAEAPQCSLKNEFFVGLLYLGDHIPKNFSAISVERL